MSYATGDPLKVRVRVAFGANIAASSASWTWTDVTAWWHVPDEVSISWGRSAGADQAETSTMSLTLKNTDGRFTAYNPLSPYWPNVKKWTPIQYDIDLGDGSGWRNRFSGFVRKWPVTLPGNSSRMALARIDAVGVLGRISRGRPPSWSPLRRSITASGPAAYWPVEDGSASGQVASAVSGHTGMAITGLIEFAPVTDYIFALASVQVRYGTSALASIAGGGQFSTVVPASVTTATGTNAGWRVHITAKVDITTIPSDVTLLEWDTPGGTYVRWRLVIERVSSYTTVYGIDANGTGWILAQWQQSSPAFSTYEITASQSGTTMGVALYVDGGSAVDSANYTANLGGITRIAVNTGGTTSTAEMVAGHVAIWAGTATPYRTSLLTDSYGGFVREARRSYDNETAVNRLTRLVAEDGLTLTVPAVPDDVVTRMGWQPVTAPVDLYQECETADQGLLYESGFGLGYVPRASRYNPAVALTIDGNARQLGGGLEPVDDDQQLRNRWTIERPSGSSAVAADDTSITQQGLIESSATVNLVDDTGLADQAAWRLRQSTVAELRYPSITVPLSVARTLAAAWCACLPGSRVQVVNPPDQVPGVVDQLIVGARETYRGRRDWQVTLSTVPASPWLIAVLDGEQRVAADGSTLASGITASATTFSLASTAANGVWTTAGADFPLDVAIGGAGGEQVRLSGITGTTSPQTATVAASGRAINGVSRAWPAGTAVDVWQPAITPL